MLGFQTWGCIMVGTDKTTELPLQPQQLTFWADIVVHLLTLKRSFPRLILNIYQIKKIVMFLTIEVLGSCCCTVECVVGYDTRRPDSNPVINNFYCVYC